MPGEVRQRMPVTAKAEGDEVRLYVDVRRLLLARLSISPDLDQDGSLGGTEVGRCIP